MMPTGYTAPIYEGQDVSFADWAMQCARAFGALITMRDDPADTPIPDEFEPSSYDERRLTQLQAEWQRLHSLTIEQAEAEAEAEFTRAMRQWESDRQRRADLRVRYESMLAEVHAWTPPTAEHIGLKDFMVEQLEGAIRFDCDSDDEQWRPVRKSAQDWLTAKIEATHKSIGWSAEGHAKEVARAKSRTAWVKALRESLAAHMDGSGSAT